MTGKLAVSMGDPAGIGLELLARVWADRAQNGAPPFLLVGDSGAFERASARLGLPAPKLRAGPSASDEADTLEVIPVPLAMGETPGEPDPANARAVIAAIERGVGAALKGEAAALVTLPIAKANLYAAGFGFPGHTEFIAHLCADVPWARARGPVMMLAGESLKVALATIHTPLAQVPEALSADALVDTIAVVGEALRLDFGLDAPRMALCGLNPHAGERGAIGREEIEIINPAAALARERGWDISDARPADTLFHAEARQGYDAAIAMYHDQGLIPLKTLHFWDAANVTLGLPIVRTSPDHGVGFAIAGEGVARPDSLLAAMKLAHQMAARRAAR